MTDCLNLEAKLMCGDESFHDEEGITQPLSLIDFWKWSASILTDNTVRGILAEFLVASALGLHKTPRRAWEGVDLRLESGTEIEVKSAAYVQSWHRHQSQYSTIRFSIAPRCSWNAETRGYSGERKRWSDIYVFCVFTGKSNPIDPMDLRAWDFYVLSTKILDQKMNTQKTIGLNSLKNLDPAKCKYGGLRETILNVEEE